MFWPLIRLSNKNYGFKELLGMVWGGLRGVMSIVFAVIVVVDVQAGSARFRDLCVYFSAVTVLMSMCFNRLTVEWFWEKIRLIYNSPAQAEWEYEAHQEHLRRNFNAFREIKKMHHVRFANWKDVQRLAGFDKKTTKTLQKFVEARKVVEADHK